MPVQHAIWRMGDQATALSVGSLANENELEEFICAEPAILSDRWLLIGRQVPTAHGKFVDLLAVDGDGALVVIELKKQRTPRDVVAQALDYGSWVRTLEPSDVAAIFKRFAGDGQSLDAAFQEKFGYALDEEQLNESHQLVVVASELDASTERIVGYLSDSDIPINVIFFQVFTDGDRRYLSRAWLIDPGETEAKVAAPKRGKEPWNGEYYASYGIGEGRTWDDARRYGYISAGGGAWYSRTLFQLQPGDRVWVNIPRTGYVGVGQVTASAVPVQDFKVRTDKGTIPLREAETASDKSKWRTDDEDKNEYCVAIDWLKEVPLSEAVSEVGFFGNQNSVAKPTAAKWVHTVERLKAVWGIE